MSIHVGQGAVEAASACARHIAAVLEQAAAAAGHASLAVSGGGTPRPMFDALARAGLPWDRIHVFWADERAVPPDDPRSNFRLTEKHLLRPAGIPATQIHRMRGELPPEEAAELYDRELRGLLPLDVVQLGMGADGHTASLFPGSPNLENRAGIAAPAFNGSMDPPWRVTLLPGVLLAARHIVFLVAGADKAETLRAVLDGPYEPQRYPAQLIQREGRKVEWFVDRAAVAGDARPLHG